MDIMKSKEGSSCKKRLLCRAKWFNYFIANDRDDTNVVLVRTLYEM